MINVRKVGWISRNKYVLGNLSTSLVYESQRCPHFTPMFCHTQMHYDCTTCTRSQDDPFSEQTPLSFDMSRIVYFCGPVVHCHCPSFVIVLSNVEKRGRVGIMLVNKYTELKMESR